MTRDLGNNYVVRWKLKMKLLKKKRVLNIRNFKYQVDNQIRGK